MSGLTPRDVELEGLRDRIQAIGRLNEKLANQRDTLADMLYLALGALHHCEPTDITAADFLPETITARSLAALRLAGRLPQEWS